MNQLFSGLTGALCVLSPDVLFQLSLNFSSCLNDESRQRESEFMIVVYKIYVSFLQHSVVIFL